MAEDKNVMSASEAKDKPKPKGFWGKFFTFLYMGGFLVILIVIVVIIFGIQMLCGG